MSKFAAIEARATQYPASANDVVWLTLRVAELQTALTLLGNAYPTGGLCFCGMAIGNPMYRDHSKGCQQARQALEHLHEPNVP